MYLLFIQPETYYKLAKATQNDKYILNMCSHGVSLPSIILVVYEFLCFQADNSDDDIPEEKKRI